MTLVNILFGLSDSVSLIPCIGGSFVLAAVSWNFLEQPVLARKPSLGPASSLTCVN